MESVPSRLIRLLLVIEHQLARELLEPHLTSHGVRVEAVDNVDAAVEAIHENRDYAVVLINIANGSRMDCEDIRRIVAADTRVPVTVLDYRASRKPWRSC